MLRRILPVLVSVAVVAAACGDGRSAAPELEEPTVRVATLNVLHGLFCDFIDTDWCNAPARIEILGRHLEDAGCPDLVGLQEIGPRQEELIPDLIGRICDGAYTLSWGAQPGPDRGMILTTLPIVDEGLLDLSNFPWEANWVRVETDLGAVVFLTAHFASSANNPPCDAQLCPTICPPGIETNECHALEVVDFFDHLDTAADLTIVAGDLNARIDENDTLAALMRSGFVDTWLTAGNAECDPASGGGCTGGGAEPDTPFIGMDTPTGIPYDERIDYILVRTAEGCTLRVQARGFADGPVAEPVDGMFWPSDHAGVQATLACA